MPDTLPAAVTSKVGFEHKPTAHARRCLECIVANDVASARFASLIWACSHWGYRLQRSELEQLVPVAADPITAGWEEGGRGGGLQLVEALTRQAGSGQPGTGVDPITAGWEEGGRGGGLQLVEALTRQAGSGQPGTGV